METTYESDESDPNHNNSLIVILRRSAEFLSIGDALNILLLNKSIRNHMINSEWKMMISLKAISEFFEVRDEKKILTDFKNINIENEKFYKSIINSNNKLQNPCGELGLKHWNVEGR